jgi:hypothetical protein
MRVFVVAIAAPLSAPGPSRHHDEGLAREQPGRAGAGSVGGLAPTTFANAGTHTDAAAGSSSTMLVAGRSSASSPIRLRPQGV